MKTALLSLIRICLLNSIVFSTLKAQSCNFYDLRLNSQSSVNSFSSACTTVTGDITISGADITDLSPLQNIEIIKGKLTIQNNTHLTSLSGLKNLTSTQHLLIYTNDLLTDLSGLEKLKAIWGTTHIRYNKSLVTLKGLDNLTDANTFYITNNDLLVSMSGLGSLETVSDIISISANPSLTTLKGLNSITNVSRIIVSGNDALPNLLGLESLTTVSYQMHVSLNKTLTSLNGLTHLVYLSEAYFSKNESLPNLSGLESVTYVKWLVVGENESLTSLTGLNNLVSATNFIIRTNKLLTDLSGLENVTNIGWLQVSDNAELTNLSGMGTATESQRSTSDQKAADLTIGGLVIRDNPKLTSCSVSSVCDFVRSNTATITGNGSGCETASAVQAACGLLPVTLSNFKASTENRTALLQWTTTDESNSSVFKIEHSTDAKTWRRVGELDAKGESNTLVSYKWTDVTPASGLNYYRLKMVDLDDSYSYSHIVSLKFGDLAQIPVIVYPNPASDVLFIENHKEIVRLRIVSLQGKTVYETNSAPNTLSIKNFAAGLYQVHIIRQSGLVQEERIVIL